MWCTHVQHEDAKFGGLVGAQPLPGGLDVLLELLDGVLEGGPGVVDLVNDEDALADQVLHLAQGAQVEPLGAGDLCAGDLGDAGGGVAALGLGEGLVEGEADGLDRDVGASGLLEEGAQDTGGDVAAAADGDDQMGLEVVENLLRGVLAELVDLEGLLSAGSSGRARLAACVSGACMVTIARAHSSRGEGKGRSHIVVGNEDLLDFGHFEGLVCDATRGGGKGWVGVGG